MIFINVFVNNFYKNKDNLSKIHVKKKGTWKERKKNREKEREFYSPNIRTLINAKKIGNEWRNLERAERTLYSVGRQT